MWDLCVCMTSMTYMGPIYGTFVHVYLVCPICGTYVLDQGAYPIYGAYVF